MTSRHLEVTPTAGDQRRSEKGPDRARYFSWALFWGSDGDVAAYAPIKKSNLHANARFLTSEIPTDKRTQENLSWKTGGP